MTLQFCKPKNSKIRLFFHEVADPPQKSIKRKRPSPVTLRLTHEERAKLEELAGSMTLSAYIRMCCLNEDAAQRKSSERAPVKDHEAIGKILGLLGHSRIASNLNQLAKAANTGALLLDDETKRQINDAYSFVLKMRTLLMQALGCKS